MFFGERTAWCWSGKNTAKKHISEVRKYFKMSTHAGNMNEMFKILLAV
jgi:hypothetical protein